MADRLPHQNGRLSRVLTTLLLLQAGYAYVPYSSLESEVEQNSAYAPTIRHALLSQYRLLSSPEAWAAALVKEFTRITADSHQMGGIPCIRRLRIEEYALSHGLPGPHAEGDDGLAHDGPSADDPRGGRDGPRRAFEGEKANRGAIPLRACRSARAVRFPILKVRP